MPIWLSVAKNNGEAQSGRSVVDMSSPIIAFEPVLFEEYRFKDNWLGNFWNEHMVRSRRLW